MVYIIEFVKIGFHCAAILMAYFTYKLIQKVLLIYKEAHADKKSDFKDTYKIIKSFMYLSLFFFVIGVAAQIFTTNMSNSISANIHISPSHWPNNVSTYQDLITVKCGNKKLTFDEGLAEINELEDKDNLRIVLDKVVNDLSVTKSLNALLLKDNTPGGGFGN